MRLLFLLLLTATTTLLQAQLVTGVAKDEAGSPISGTTISLHRASDSAVVKLAVSKENGAYSFTGIKEGSYRVSASHIGYKTSFTGVFTFSGSDVNAPELKLSKQSGSLSNVTVVAAKPMVEVKADKTILNVEGTINAVGSNALELLRKSPGVLLDKDENISLAGKNGVQVYIDNRPSPLAGADLATYLKTLQSSQIEAIELITNPSAKYDAAGNAGKPIRLPRFLAAVQKAVEQINAHNESSSHEMKDDDFLFVKTESKGKLLKINLADIDFIESMKNYVAIHRGGQKTLVYTSMKELEERLPKKQFIRVHKSFIIPIARITGIEGNLVRLKNVSSEVLIGENYKAELMAIIKGKMIQ